MTDDEAWELAAMEQPGHLTVLVRQWAEDQVGELDDRRRHHWIRIPADEAQPWSS